jgi:molybdenum cofactor cytidylyltransferase
MKIGGIIILAAGNSSRLGEAKQLLTFRNKTLLKHVVDEALAVPGTLTIVVTGSEKERLAMELEGSDAVTCYNAEWAQGMSASIRVGLNKLKEMEPEVACCIIAVCDQPYITSGVFKGLLEKLQETSCGIIASSYADTAGTPVLFGSPYFDDLLSLKGHEGAKKLLNIYAQQVLLCPFPNGEVDVDTRQDYQNLLSGSYIQ